MIKKIFIMEDEKILQNILMKKLSSNGYEVRAVDDGSEGITIIEDGYVPDLILLDMLMPHVDGFYVLEKLKNDEKYSSIPIIIISNSGQPVEVEKALSLGIVDYLVKADFNPNEVLEKVNKYFNNNKSEEKLSQAEEEEEEVKTEATSNDGLKIVLAEDDDFLRDICETKLKKEGFSVIAACNGVEALAKIKEENPNIILLDIIMPEMDGFEVLKKIKEIPEKASIPVIMLTNLGQTSEIEKGFALGAEDYIIKAHFTVGEIIEKVREIIEKKKGK
ncbi:MAG: response regulator [Candidatus Pacebacteria bacterium]|nr:response regulator [Candidatus Paceibacterota bacterium]